MPDISFYMNWCKIQYAEHQAKAKFFKDMLELLAAQDGGKVLDHNPDALYEEIICMIPEESMKALQDLTEEAQAMGFYDTPHPEVTSTCGEVYLEFDLMKEKESE